MPLSFTKTAPVTAQHTGALIRHALTAHGVPHRVEASFSTSASLVTTGHEEPSLYITSQNHNGHMHYDLPRTAHLSFSAVVTTATGTHMIYFGDDLPPEKDAEACAAAVAAYLRHPTYDAPTPQAPDCDACEDYGYTKIYDASTDAPIGTDPCTVPECVARRAVAAARWEEEYALAERAADDHAAVCSGAECCPPF